MNEILKDWKILHCGMVLLHLLKITKVVLTVGIIVFSALEVTRWAKDWKKQSKIHKFLPLP